VVDNKKIKVLMCCIGPETHNRGILTVSKYLRDAGMEVVYMGNASAEEAIKVAIEESVDVVGISSLSGGHLSVGKILFDLASSKGIAQKIGFTIGGVIPPLDIPKLMALGYRSVYPSGSTREQIINGIKDAVVA
jgi:methylmalonyl-CoA mutase C-terminal domain/subunit